jgi:two-component system, NarL family, sensor kinase
VQEGLANVHRHSRSRTATVRLEIQRAELILQIEDQGCGMPEILAIPPGRVGSLGVGILGMRQRLRQHGGNLEIDSSSQGTTVRATVPLSVKRRLRARTRRAGA